MQYDINIEPSTNTRVIEKAINKKSLATILIKDKITVTINPDSNKFIFKASFGQ